MRNDKTTKGVGLHELYRENPEQADKLVFGRETDKGRRGFLRGMGLGTMATMLGVGAIPFHRNMPGGLIPAALADSPEPFTLEGKSGLTILNDRPINAETPPHLLDDDITPIKYHFVRDNGIPPASVDANSWELTIDGMVDKPLTLKIADLRSEFDVVTQNLVIECGGNGRAFFRPPAKGNQWTYGAVGCSAWTGVRLADVLKAAGVKPEAVYTAHYGADTHLSGNPNKQPISRGVPIAKAMQPENLIAFAMNGREIHPLNGAPLRLVIPGWPGSCSQKWLTRIQLRDRVHDGAKMTGKSYRVPNRPVAPGEKVPESDFVIIERMPVKSLITFPETGIQLKEPSVEVRGHAWAGDRQVKEVHLSNDFGATWIKAQLSPPPNKAAWQRFKAKVTFPQKGYYEVWARAVDSDGISQPFAISWNPKGYLNNSYHRIAVTVV